MYEQIALQDAESLLVENTTVIVDVRDKDSYIRAHIPNALHLSVTELQKFCEKTPKSSCIVVYCYRGISSQSVAQHLVDQGFQKVHSLAGGFEAWEKDRLTKTRMG
ncbi:MAG: thiosulfate sulfurtransferase [Gammaproteobacteria bacterium RIFCSPLOWO2_02_FULL_42_14]|nr:MAG: thiosulfate sulfurtransferase [Gammaproteobacteria bacterium RIFCSPHIGHO2_02_FULL_42_43]OGT28305.1 MAG: thiosulfate sulfurtransferase [Gammaproteobacteria bacterium RIFCSPHIGHO2_01_FULL_42_8]OGT52250.1 MAG: thiosulfate sulfurtransferase [Gammaproteobacteria bacterium RIFCSPHIGHO2_12_FULL_41_25]OGT61863.1 MAG: thiosulfate sulfurtransferase [Gammaproteobacteria bacterium RIFCSPLOWO2_02_FULL_42_14]OGT86426.1 MAG: thiosulfate sulfurtransferase [Gammaproteobacteria bacterium RIFCSPLOWO2_12_F